MRKATTMSLPTTQIELAVQRIANRGTTRTQLLPVELSDIFQRASLGEDLATVERMILQATASRSSLLTAAGAHTIAAGGKRLRAALVLLAGRLGRYDLERLSRPAAAIELLHAASLVHDDLVDHSERRRGRETAHRRWGSQVALMLGDFLFAASAHVLAAEPDTRIIKFYTHAAQMIVEGELNPVIQLQPLDVALAQYHHKVGCKTAALFEVACKAGSAIGGGDEAEIAALGRFGYNLGVAFQIIDDILDFTGDEVLLGKPVGNDLREGTLTLPLIYAAAQSNNPLLHDITNNPALDPRKIPQIVAAVIDAGGVDLAMDEARATIARAMSQLARFPSSNTVRALSEICDFVLNR